MTCMICKFVVDISFFHHIGKEREVLMFLSYLIRFFIIIHFIKINIVLPAHVESSLLILERKYSTEYSYIIRAYGICVLPLL